MISLFSVVKTITLPSLFEIANNIPLDSSPLITTGFKLATITTVLPIKFIIRVNV